jgi:hypothetical protein
VFLLALIACFFLLGIAHKAEARTLTSTERAEIQDVTDRAWPTSRCANNVRIIWTSHIQPAADDTATQRELSTGRYALAGYAYGMRDGSCDVAVDPTRAPQDACTTAVHEAGHLAGLEHDDGLPVMGDQLGVTDPTYVWPACSALMWMGVDDARSYMYERFPNSAIACKRQTASRFQCIRHRDSSRTRQVWRVWTIGPDAIRAVRV